MNSNGQPRRAPASHALTVQSNGVLKFEVGRYRLLFARDDTAAWPRFSGSAWRGAFGRALRQAVCVTRLENCATCLLKASCAVLLPL